MAGVISDYLKTHQLQRKYGLAIAVVLAAALVSKLLGDRNGIVVLKTMVAIPFATLYIILPSIFDPVLSSQPFTPSFIERAVLEAVLAALAMALLLWSPVNHPTVLLGVSALAFLAYCGGRCLIARWAGR